MGLDTVKFSELVNFSEKQMEATRVADVHKFFLYGGAMGGGKSYWLRWYMLRWLIKTYKETGLKNVVGGLFCEDYPTLKDRQISKLAMEVPEWMGQLKEDKVFALCLRLDPSLGGGVLALRNLDDPSKYKSSEFGIIGIDELTKDPYSVFKDLRNRIRWPGLPRGKFVAGTNPGDIGHEWVKRYFIDKKYPKEEKEGHEFAYVPARATDNPYLSPEYVLTLESMDENERKMYLEGSWDVFEGQYFVMFNRDKHVVPVIPRDSLPAHWPNFRSIDVSGRNGITSCHWYTLDGDGNVWVYREYYVTGKDNDEHAENIWYMSHMQFPNGEWGPDEGYRYTVMDSAAWSKMGLPETTMEVYYRKWEELDKKHAVVSSSTLVPSDKNREFGWDIVNSYLRHTPEVPTKLKIMDNCPNIIRTFPLLMRDEKNAMDVDTTGEDHAQDDLRYFLQTLRGQKADRVKSRLERRLEEMKEAADRASYNWSYTRAQ